MLLILILSNRMNDTQKYNKLISYINISKIVNLHGFNFTDFLLYFF